MTATPRQRRLLVALLVGSALLRIALALQGGQFFFGDESRYNRGVAIYQALRTGDSTGLREQLRWPEHLAFNYVNTLVAAAQHGLAQFTRHGDWTKPPNIEATWPLGAAVLSLFSVLNIWLVHRLARSAGADESEALWAALLVAASNTLFYDARHFLPYDAALAAALAALLFASADGTARGRVVSGIFTAAAFETYNGYWFLVPVVFAAVLLAAPSAGARWRDGLRWGAGFAGGLAGLLLPGMIAGGAFFWSTMRGFSGSALQGLFAEGWSLPWEYFWHSEGWLGVLVAVAALAGLARAAGSDPAAPRLRRWLLLAALAYLLPTLASVGLHRFVVYARTARPLVPLLGLAAAPTLHRFARWRPPLAPLTALLVLVGALAHFVPHYGRIFPRDVEAQVLRQYGMTKHWLSFTGSIYSPLPLPGERPGLALADAQIPYPVRTYRGYPAGTVLFSVTHPMSYLPYQYEGYTPRERALLRAHPFAMKLIRLADPASVPYHPPVADLFSEADRPDGYDRGRPQP